MESQEQKDQAEDKSDQLAKDRSEEKERELYGKLDPMELNNTRKAKKEILFFNRVPKVGSQTTMELMKSLSNRNKFQYQKDGVQKMEKIKMSFNEEVRWGTKCFAINIFIKKSKIFSV